jgi:hypothetical protein
MTCLDLPSSFNLARYRFTLEALDPIHLHPFKGSALRGGFGYTLKRLVCYRSRGDCKKCLLGNDCVYGYLFETSPPKDAEVLRTHEAIPRPFVIQPPLDRRTTFEPGDRLDFHLVLVGRSIAYLPYFALVFQELGRTTGLGRSRGQYALRDVQAVHPLNGQEQPVYDGETLLSTEVDLTAGEITAWAERLPADRLPVRFLTPARLKHGGRFARETVDFHVLVRALLRRLSSLAYFHGGAQWDTDYPGWIERAREVETVESHLSWMAWGRRSGRQARRINMGGVVGDVTYAGSLAPFRPLLALGQWIHVGKGTVFGNGQYRLNHTLSPSQGERRGGGKGAS